MILGCVAAPALLVRAGFLESGAAFHQMQRIIEAQGPTTCRSELGTLTADIHALRDGVVSSIDCLRLDRLARTTGAALDEGAGSNCTRRSATASTRASHSIAFMRSNSRNSTWRWPWLRRMQATRSIATVWPSGRNHQRRRDSVDADASHTGRQLAAILGVPANEIAVHRLPDGELRVTVGPAAPTTIVFGSLVQPMKS